MKRTILILACALIAPLAFAQTSTTSETKTTTGGTTTTETTTTTAEGTVTTFTPGESIVVKTTTGVDPISYLLGKTVHYVNKAGNEIEASLIRPGTKVHVMYDREGEKMMVNRVVVDED